MSSDFDTYKALWEQIDDLVVPDPPPNQEPKACLLLETTGFSIDPEYYNYDSFNESFRRGERRPSPAYLSAQLCDKIPALSLYFYDTGGRISYKWKQLLLTFWLKHHPANDDKVDASWLHQKWQDTIDLYRECWKDEGKGVEYFASKAGAIIEEVEQMFSEHPKVKFEDDVAAEECASGGPGVLFQEAMLDMAKFKRYDTGSSAEYYETLLQPANWYEWFEDGYNDDSGWTSVKVSSKEGYISSKDTFSKLLDTAYSFAKGLFQAFSGNSTTETPEGHCGLTISFKVRKVNINRPWLHHAILEYPTVGMINIPKHKWSNGTLDQGKNKGSFPLLPTSFIVAKDVVFSDLCMSPDQHQHYHASKRDASSSVSFGCFLASGNIQSDLGSKGISSEYDDKNEELKINGCQIIGWVCSVIPPFPQVEEQGN